MAEQSVEEIRRLARNFLIGKGGPGDLADLKREMESDPQLPFELLHLMQTALDEVPPAGFSPDQWKEMDARIVSMVNPLLRSGFGKLSQIFSGLFKKRAKEQAPSSRLRRRGMEEPEPMAALTQAPPQAVVRPLDVMDSMEEMAPIATAPAPAPTLMPSEPVEKPSPLKLKPSASAPVIPPKIRVPRVSGKIRLLVASTLLAVLAFAVVKVWLSVKPRKPKVEPAIQQVAVPSAQPMAQPENSSGLPSRSRGVIQLGQPLPSELAPRTPQMDESFAKPGDLEAKDTAGNHGFPLP